MKLKEILIGVAAVVLVALVAVGATLAYLTATDEVTNVMTVGDVDLEILEFERVSTDTSGVDAQLQAFTNSTKKLIPSIVPAEFDYTKKEATVNWDKDKDGKEGRLSDFIGKRIVLYFYPKDNTPGCTRQACAFAGAYKEFEARDVVVIGISRDSVASHAKFAAKYELPFVLLSDPELSAIEAYGVWQEKKMCGKTAMGVVRTTYIIDENGVISHVMPKVKPDTNAQDVLEALGR